MHDRVRRAELNRPAQGRPASDGLDYFGAQRNHLFRVNEQLPALDGQEATALVSLEQASLQLLFELRDARGYSGLCRVQPFRGTVKSPQLGDGVKGLQVSKIDHVTNSTRMGKSDSIARIRMSIDDRTRRCISPVRGRFDRS
ncbi:hypothetical protein QZM97_08495 [Burkholderia orbicola]|nr:MULTISPECIES: hypothetical protein [Burkholderia]MDN7779585.1 hypothetical protein [Burkholderia orbicola]MDN7990125.1 hypothetical protein [Burkholderia orbicola]